MADSISSPDSFVSSLLEKLKRHPKRVVFPEANDPRVLRVAHRLVEQEVVLPILLGNRDQLKQSLSDLGLKGSFIHIIDPATASDLDLFCNRFVRTEKFRGVTVDDPRSVMVNPHYFAAMMVQYGQADTLVAGNQSHPTLVYRSLTRLIKPLPHVPAPFAVNILVDNRKGDDQRLFIAADCGLHQDPNPTQLASIAVEAGLLARQIHGRPPRVALLSHSMKGSSSSTSALKVASATALAREAARDRMIDMSIDGEIQADLAVSPSVGVAKNSHTSLDGQADVIVFPSLDAADISLRLLTQLGCLRTYGELLLGLGRPAAQVPRSVSEESLFGTVATVAVEAIKHHELYPEGETGGIIW